VGKLGEEKREAAAAAEETPVGPAGQRLQVLIRTSVAGVYATNGDRLERYKMDSALHSCSSSCSCPTGTRRTIYSTNGAQAKPTIDEATYVAPPVYRYFGLSIFWTVNGTNEWVLEE